jgi:hypothetical protein
VATIQPCGRHRQVAAVPQAPRTLPRCPQAAAASHVVGPRMDSRPRQASAAAADTVGGGWRPLPLPVGVRAGGRPWTVGCPRPPCPPCSGRRPPPAVDSGRPATTGLITSRTADTPRCLAPRTSAGGSRARSAQPADSDGPDAWTVDAAGDTGSRGGHQLFGQRSHPWQQLRKHLPTGPQPCSSAELRVWARGGAAVGSCEQPQACGQGQPSPSVRSGHLLSGHLGELRRHHGMRTLPEPSVQPARLTLHRRSEGGKGQGPPHRLVW